MAYYLHSKSQMDGQSERIDTAASSCQNYDQQCLLLYNGSVGKDGQGSTSRCPLDKKLEEDLHSEKVSN